MRRLFQYQYILLCDTHSHLSLVSAANVSLDFWNEEFLLDIKVHYHIRN